MQRWVNLDVRDKQELRQVVRLTGIGARNSTLLELVGMCSGRQ